MQPTGYRVKGRRTTFVIDAFRVFFFHQRNLAGTCKFIFRVNLSLKSDRRYIGRAFRID